MLYSDKFLNIFLLIASQVLFSCCAFAEKNNINDQSAFMIDAETVTYDPICEVHATGYYYYPIVKSCYKISILQRTWDEAYAECKKEGAHLAVLNSPTESLVVANMAAMDESVHDGFWDRNGYSIGFRKVNGTTDSKPVFKNIFNQSLKEAGYNVWVSGKPNNVGGKEDCGAVYLDGRLTNVKCFRRQYPYICEKEVINYF